MSRTRPLGPRRVDDAALPQGSVLPAQRTHTTVLSDAADALSRALGDYVRMVAEAVGVPREGTTCEVTDTVTAYLALNCRSAQHPGRDLMLAWSASQGWVLSVETAPAEPPVVLSRAGRDLVPAPGAVARFVAESTTPRPRERACAVLPAHVDWSDLAERMERHTRPARDTSTASRKENP
ncbi:DUF6292 family protein [Saccharothrix coeruleofusca]|uniref:DUF6292 domain-containing protein n=1 Tax=Saccharothrix coeruleofusca TaxID=33919 RepID=A0A918AUG3_9PSEU|nr:DUF6292 family protein [Saccharothrix coeruleofusca]MBP2336738.1 hypothetical protein [Saccharothrix coeruleofusca]GGP78404.1 hypothetical protein GCM10010185_60190 [Saccharothrix coeruleofusca]